MLFRSPSQVVVPDFLVSVVDAKLELKLNGRNAPELNVSREYKEMLSHYRQAKGFDNDQQKEAFTFIKSKIDSAKITVPARRRKITARSHIFRATVRNAGRR